MKRFGIVIALFAAVVMKGSAWAGDSNFYAKASVAAVGSGSGTVYIAPSSGETTGVTAVGDGNSSYKQTAQKGGGTVDAYFYAIPAAGSSFKGWSKTSGKTDLGQGGVNGELQQRLTTATKADATNDNGTWYALFEKNPDVVVTFNAPMAGQGTYTATDGTTTVANEGEITTSFPLTLTAQAASGYRLYGWYTLSGDTKTYFAYTATAEYTALEATTIGVDFIAESQVAKVSDLDALQTALNESLPIIEIESGATVVVPAGETLTVQAGKKLTVAGKLAVAGTLNVAGIVDGSGKVLKVTKVVTQGPVITPTNTYTEYPSAKYRKTETADNTPTLTGATPQCTVVYGVSVTGLGIFEMSSASPKILKVTFDTGVAINSIKSVTGSTDTTTASEPYLLLADAKLNAPVVEEKNSSGTVYKRLRYTSTLDCAGHKCTISDYQVSSSFSGKFLNGTVEYTGDYWQQGSAWFYNCGSVAMKKLKGAGNKFYYYDCGTMASPASVSFTYYSGTRTTDYRNAYFYSGVYKYSFSATDDTGMCHVYGGSYNNNPTNYLEHSAAPNGLEAPGPVDGYYTVYAKEPPLELVKIGDTAYPSLQKAITAAEPGAKLLLNGLNELSGTVMVPAGKQLTIDLNGFTLTGGTIVNEGALRFEDNSGQAVLGTMSSSVVNNGNGTIDIAYGTYAGTFTVNGGTLTTHEGAFTSTFATVENGGTVALKGGRYAGVITVPEGYRIEGGKLGEVIQGDMNPNNPISATQADFSYTVRGLPDDDNSWTLYSRFKQGTVARSAYTDAEWDRLSELRSAIEPIESRAIEATLVFDRPVVAGSFSGVAKIMGVTRDMPIDRDLAANEEFHVLIPLIESNGYTAKSYKYMFDGSENGVWSTLLCGGKNHSVDNIGATCTLKFQLRISERAPDYTTQNNHLVYTFYDIASQSYTFTGKGAIFDGTDYTSLQAALAAADYAGTVLLSKDCTEQVTVSRATSFVLDTNSFAFTGSIAAGDGFELKTEDLGDGRTRYMVVRTAAVSTSNVLVVKRVPGIDGAAAGTEVVAAVPWKNVALTADVTVDRLIATGVATGDEIAAWDSAQKKYYVWHYTGTAWEPATDARTNVEVPAANAYTLARGTAVWYQRANPSVAYSQVGGYDTNAVATVVTQGGTTSANKPANTLLINPYYEAVDLAQIAGANGDQIQILSNLKVYTNKGGKWGELQLETVSSPFGPVKQQKFVEVATIPLPAGEGFWYISKGGQPEIDWKALAPSSAAPQE